MINGRNLFLQLALDLRKCASLQVQRAWKQAFRANNRSTENQDGKKGQGDIWETQLTAHDRWIQRATEIIALKKLLVTILQRIKPSL